MSPKRAGQKRKFPSRYDLRLLPAAIGAWGSAAWGIGVGAGLVRTVALSAGVSVVILMSLLLWARRKYPVNARVWQRGVLVVLLAGGVSGAVLGLIAVKEARFEKSLLFQAQRTEGWVQVRGKISSDVRKLRQNPAASWQGERWRVELSVQSAHHRGHREDYGARLVLMGDDSLAQLQAGETADFAGKLKATDAGDAARGILFATEIDRVAPPSGVYAAGGQMRQRFRSAAAALPTDARGLVPGIVVGDTSQLPTEVDQAMRDTSLTHLTAVSGAHCTLIIGAALGLTRPPRHWSLRRRRWVRASAALVTLSAFIVVTGPQPSVLRAGVMGAVGLFGLLRGRKSRAISALAVAVIVLLILDPWLARDAGFSMSVLSTAAIVVAAGPVSQWLRERRVPKALALALAVSASAQVACLPVLLAIDPRLTLYSLPANVLATPLFPFISLPGAAGLLMCLIVPPLAPAILWLTVLPAQGISSVAQTMAALPGATVERPPPPGAWWALGAAVILVAAALVGRAYLPRHFGAHFFVHRRFYGVLGGSAVLIVVLIAGTGVGKNLRGLAGGGNPERDWFAVQCDVGQGDALVIRSSPGAIMMIDVGPPGTAAAKCLQDLGVNEIDLLVLTHWHLDHVGGLEPVLDQAEVQEVLVPVWEEPRATSGPAQAVLAAVSAEQSTGMLVESLPEPELANSGLSVDQFVAGTSVHAEGRIKNYGKLPGIEWQLVWPTARAVDLIPAGADDGTSVNDLSNVLALRIATTQGEVWLLALGDVEESGQRGVLRSLHAHLPQIQVDVLKMAHHGSNRQSEELAALLQPRVALIGVGAENDYGHPSQSAWDMYANRGTQIGSTDRHGRVMLTPGSDDDLQMLLETRVNS